MTKLTYFDLGYCSYDEALLLQLQLLDQVRSAHKELACLMLLEHDPPVITLGRSARPEHVLASADRLTSLGIELHKTSRGGDVAYHGPGQLVGYPILSLQHRRLNVHQYLRNLEEALMRLLERFAINSRRIDGLTGVWVGDEKIAAIGIAVRRWVTYHGFALNVSPDMSHFETIVPCGIVDKHITSLEKLVGESISVNEIKDSLTESMAEVFGFESARKQDIQQFLPDHAYATWRGGS